MDLEFFGPLYVQPSLQYSRFFSHCTALCSPLSTGPFLF